jgi:hypothetical protein
MAFAYPLPKQLQTAESVATSDVVDELGPLHQAFLLKAIWVKLDAVEKMLAALMDEDAEP